MLLTEIVATRHARPGDPRGEYEFIPDIEASIETSKMGVQPVKVQVNPPELNFYKRHNIPLPKKQFPCVHAYTLVKHDTEEARTILDAIKKRAPLKPGDPTSFMSNSNILAFMSAAISKLKKGPVGSNTTQLSGTKSYAKNALSQISRWLKSGDSSLVVVPLDSSSEVVKIMARLLAKEMNAPLVNGAFIKSLPHLSKLIQNEKTGEITKRTNKARDWHQYARNLRLSIKKLEAELEHLNTLNPPTEKEMNKLIREIELKTRRKQRAEFKLENLTFQVKKIDRKSTAGGTLYYKILEAIPEQVKRLHGANIILVDDNVESGLTMSDALKALHRVRVIPNQIIGFCPHKLTSPPKPKTKEEDDQEDI